MGGTPGGEAGSGGPKPLEKLKDPQLLPFLTESRAAEILEALDARKAQVTELLNRIASGKSQLSIDTSSFLQGVPPDSAMGALARAEAEAFRQQQMEYLKYLAQTEAGFKLLSDLDASTFKTSIGTGTAGANETSYADRAAASIQADGSKGAGSNVTISMNPALTTFANPGEEEQPWMTERQRYGLYHEMVHAWHAVQGDRATGSHNGINNAEWQAVGMGPYAAQPISENIIRQQMGKALRPTYAGVGY